MSPRPQPPVPAAARLATRALWVSTLLLLGLGGLVTTYRVGMAVHDWPTTFGHSMFAYPLSDMVRDGVGVSFEHSHRMLASIVGMLTLVALLGLARGRGLVAAALGLAAEIGCVAEVIRTGSIEGVVPAATLGAALLLFAAAVPLQRGARLPLGLAVLVHAAVVGQGLLGGTRVLENSQHLAFLHGSLAQLVFALVCLVALVSGTRWTRWTRFDGAGARTLPRGGAVLALVATLLVFGQIVLGAWLRHTGLHLALGVHVLVAFAAVGAVMALAARLRRGAEAVGGAAAAELLRLRKQLLVLVLAQFALGVGTLIAILVFSGGFEGQVTVEEGVTASLHVMLGALLLGACVASTAWFLRLGRRPSGATAPAPSLEGSPA